MSQLVLDRILQKVSKDAETQCWNWEGYVVDGYGKLKIGTTSHSIHRLIYSIFKGNIPDGMCVLHSCDNRRCCNPEHLWLGTRDQNNKDRRNKGRSAIGEKSGKAKLSKADVDKIRELYSTGEYSQIALGKMFNIGNRQIGYIVHNQSRVLE